MNCQKAQSMVLNFINNQLDKEETKEFIEHIRGCKDCWEEWLDEGGQLAADFKKKLQNEIDSRYNAIVKENRRQYAAKIVAVSICVAATVWLLMYLFSVTFL